MKIIYLDPLMLAEMAGAKSEPENDPKLEELRDSVRNAVLALENPAREIMIRLHFERMDVSAVADELGLTPEAVVRIGREALLILKCRLREAVGQRWPKSSESAGTCPICTHPKRTEIERIASAKSDDESWGSVNRKLKKKIGLIFRPPMILINHLKYHRESNNG